MPDRATLNWNPCMLREGLALVLCVAISCVLLLISGHTVPEGGFPHESFGQASQEKAQMPETDGVYCVKTSQSSKAPWTHTELCYSAPKSVTNKVNILPFRGKHSGQTALVVCPGPTLKDFSLPSKYDQPAAITIGFNAVIFTDFVKKHGLDYFFLQDTGRGVHAAPDTVFHRRVEEYTSFKPRIQTFYGMFQTNNIGPTDQESEDAGALRYESEYPACHDLIPLVKEVGTFMFGGSCSVAMSALQFILYTGVTNIWLAGCDVTTGYAWGKGADGRETVNKQLLRMWQTVPSFLARYYPDVRVEVIQPVGLKDVNFNVSSTTLQ